MNYWRDLKPGDMLIPDEHSIKSTPVYVVVDNNNGTLKLMYITRKGLLAFVHWDNDNVDDEEIEDYGWILQKSP